VRKPVLALAIGAFLLAGSAPAATPARVQPNEAAPGTPVTITGPPGTLTLEPLDRGPGIAPVVATIPASGTLRILAPEVPAGTRYAVVVAGAGESPVLTVTERLDEQTSVLLLGFGLLLVLALAVGGVVVHRRWRDAIS
jgi:hypothetical protein